MERDYQQRELGPWPSELLEKFRDAFSLEQSRGEGEEPRQDTMKLFRQRVAARNVCR